MYFSLEYFSISFISYFKCLVVVYQLVFYTNMNEKMNEWIIMAALWNMAGHYIFVLWCLSLYLFLAYSQRSEIGCLSHFHTWCSLSANLECMSEMCWMRLAGNTGRKTVAKNSPSGHHRTTLSACIFTTKAFIDNPKKLLNNNISSICSQNMVNFGPLPAEIGSRVWGTPPNFNGFRVLASLLQRRRLTEANRTELWTMFGRLLDWYTIHT